MAGKDDDLNTQPPIEIPPEPEHTGDMVEDRIRQVEERLAEGKPLIDPEDQDAVQEREAAEVDVGEQAGDGEEVGGGEEGDSDEGEEADAEGEEAEEAEGEGGPEEDEVDEEEEESEEEAEDEEEEEEGDIYKASIPGRRPGDPDIKLEIQGLTQDEQEGFNRLRNGYMRGEDARAQVKAANELRDSVMVVAQQMDQNPVGYISDTLNDETKVELAKFLLTEDKVFEEVFPAIVDWEHDESRRKGEAAMIERDILKKGRDAELKRAADEAARKQGDAIVEHLEGIAENLSDQNLSRFMRFALQDLDDYVKAHPDVREMGLERVNQILVGTGVFETFGLKPTLPEPEKTRRAPRKARRDRLAEARSTVEDAEKTSQRLKRKKARKRSAATTTPPGSGAPPVSHPFKKGETVEERIAYIEKHGIPRT